ncbi:putative holin-like toxin [Enterococcus ureilyticus]
MSVFEALTLMIAFATLVVLISCLFFIYYRNIIAF